MAELKRKKRNVKKNILLSIAALIVFFFTLNWFLTYRLEGFLRKELNNKVAEATDGFYQLTFDNLKVGLFTGELQITGVDLRPDSTVFARYEKADTLPDIYFKIHIDSIDFKGINLTWRINYRTLHFDLFEIKKPIVELYSPYTTKEATIDSINDRTPDNLYEMVSGYFDVVTVKKLNLENAFVSYSMHNPIIPSIYALTDVSFHAYGFMLDENSSKSGKLLYCDNFDFTTNRKQNLLKNSQFSLDAGNIQLNTKDSLIHISDVQLIPQKELWDSIHISPSNFMEANLSSIDIQGVFFTRRNGKNFVDARSFVILPSEIEYVRIDTLGFRKSRKNQTDTVAWSNWSLFGVLSPVLSNVNINYIGVDNTKLKYTQVTTEGKDLYTLSNFTFRANSFLVDSLSDQNANMLYSDNWGFTAIDLTGKMESNNHNLSVEKISLDTKEGHFFVKNVSLQPISTEGKYDYVQASIDSVNITGLNNDSGFVAQRLMIKSPDIKYFRNPSVRKPKKKPAEEEQEEQYADEGPNSVDMLIAIMNSYYVKDIILDSATFVYKQTDRKNPEILQVNNFRFYARDFLLNKYTRDNFDWYFDCSDFGFIFRDFNNYILNRQYHLSVKDVAFTGLKGDLIIHDIKLIPQEGSWNKAPDSYMKFISPYVTVQGVGYTNKAFTARSLNIVTPDIKFVKERNTAAKPKKKKQGKEKLNIASAVKRVLLDELITQGVNLEYIDKTSGNSVKGGLSALQVKKADWDVALNKKVSLQDVVLADANLHQTSSTPSKDYIASVSGKGASANTEQEENVIETVEIGNFELLNTALHSNTPDKKTSLTIPSFKFTGLEWNLKGNDSHFSLSTFDITDPILKSVMKNEMPTVTQNEENKKDSLSENKTIYETLAAFSNKISVGNFAIRNAMFSYLYADGKNRFTDNTHPNILNMEIRGLNIDNIKHSLKADDVSFATNNLIFPIDEGRYNILIDSIELQQKGKRLQVDNVRMKSVYPKMEFAYKHPTHKDWFDVEVNNITLSGIDLPAYFSDNMLKVEDVQIHDVVLRNFKNKQIEVQHNLMPMIYELIQKAPMKIDVENMDVKNFEVYYEELAKEKTDLSLIYFTGMNGNFKGFTNIVSRPNQYITLNADGNLMGSGYFTAIWKLPVDSANDRFLLDAHLGEFDLTELNQLILPMIPAKIKSGTVRNTVFSMDASSLGSQINMEFLYNDLNAALLKETENGELKEKKFVSWMANLILRDHNPRRPASDPKKVDIFVERDPYHSTFNYLWQILQPSLVESVGISYGVQNFMKGIPEFMVKMRDFFWKPAGDTSEKEEQKQ